MTEALKDFYFIYNTPHTMEFRLREIVTRWTPQFCMSLESLTSIIFLSTAQI